MWKELWERHRGKTTGTAAGMFFGFIYLIWGFWDMLVFAFLMLVGYYFGGKVERGEPLMDWSFLSRWFSDRWFR
ncbi:DUF2273 domain-containing protein [Paenibacillus turpanensis]|uniref:DUF2273 domain-containing protein n=1 Tax=Paenibacillus turpanensis TaxID=2689078 RepID=UPI00140E58FE|nr:DUF2273 domain-containing protein [Paenibacillus turpanensis]